MYIYIYIRRHRSRSQTIQQLAALLQKYALLLDLVVLAFKVRFANDERSTMSAASPLKGWINASKGKIYIYTQKHLQVVPRAFAQTLHVPLLDVRAPIVETETFLLVDALHELNLGAAALLRSQLLRTGFLVVSPDVQTFPAGTH